MVTTSIALGTFIVGFLTWATYTLNKMDKQQNKAK